MTSVATEQDEPDANYPKQSAGLTKRVHAKQVIRAEHSRQTALLPLVADAQTPAAPVGFGIV